MYQKAKDKEYSESHNMLAYKLKVYKVKNLICTEESMKDGKASCDAILEVNFVRDNLVLGTDYQNIGSWQGLPSVGDNSGDGHSLAGSFFLR